MLKSRVGVQSPGLVTEMVEAMSFCRTPKNSESLYPAFGVLDARHRLPERGFVFQHNAETV